VQNDHATEPYLGVRHILLGLGEPARLCERVFAHLGETGPLSQGVQVGRKALRIRHINGMEVRRKRPRGFK
jgi:hypothetical protein